MKSSIEMIRHLSGKTNDLGSVQTELLAIALALTVIAKNGYSTDIFASLTLTLSLRAQCERNLRLVLFQT